MAGDWIKMRTDLYRDPKVILIANILLEQGENPVTLVTHPVTPPSRDKRVTRHATVGALVSVWGVARHQGYRDGDDLRIDNVTPSVVDDIADMPGLGNAMESVGWLVSDAQGICFPRFYDEYNTDPKEAKREKNRERQRRKRERDNVRDTERDCHADVTHRVEKSREEYMESSSKEELSCECRTILKNGPRRGKPCGALGQVCIDEIWYCFTHKPKDVDFSKDFELFWEACPRKVSKSDAWAAWNKALKPADKSSRRIEGESVEEFLVRRMRDYAAFMSDKEARFVRHPATWLNGGNWDDETGSRVPTDEDLKNWRP